MAQIPYLYGRSGTDETLWRPGSLWTVFSPLRAKRSVRCAKRYWEVWRIALYSHGERKQGRVALASTAMTCASVISSNVLSLTWERACLTPASIMNKLKKILKAKQVLTQLKITDSGKAHRTA